MGKKHIYKKWMICCISIAALLLVICASAVVIVDPFFHFHAPLKDFPYVVDNQLSQNPGLALHTEYDSVITGSSMTANFDTDWFHDDMGLDAVKLTCNGAYPKDISNMLDKVYESGNTVKAVFTSIDIESYTADTDEVKYPIPKYLYDSNPFNDVEYLFNSDVLTEYIIRPFLRRDPTDMTDVYASWWTPEYYDEARVMQGYEMPQEDGDAEQSDGNEVNESSAAAAEDVQQPKDIYSAGTLANLDANICPYIEAHPETEFYFFYPAYSVLFWNDVKAGNEMDARLYEYEVIADKLMKYDNVKLFFFADDEDTITDLDNYADEIHARPEWSRYMTKCFSDGTDEVTTADEVHEHTEHLRKVIEGYDYDALFSKYESTADR